MVTGRSAVPLKVFVGYDGSLVASASLEAAGLLFPEAQGLIAHVWAPPFASDRLRHRLRADARTLDQLMEMVEREGGRESMRIAEMGATLARATGWEVEALLERTWGPEGVAIAQAAGRAQADVVLLGSRGLGGTKALLGSVSDMVVHYSERPVVVVPHPLLTSEIDVLSSGPIVVGWDGSPGSQKAFSAAINLLPRRDVVLVSVDEGSGTPPMAAGEAPGRNVRHLNTQPSLAFHNRGLADALIGSANTVDAAAVVVGSRGRSAAREILLGSVAMGTLHHCNRPVMVVPSKSEPA